MTHRYPWLSLAPLSLLLATMPSHAAVLAPTVFDHRPASTIHGLNQPFPHKGSSPSPSAAQWPPLTKQATPVSPTLLQVEGTLSDDDPTLEDGSHFDEHFFSGEAGQIIKITLTSAVFDTYLLLESPTGERIATNDDGGEGRNSQIVVQLPTTGQYRVLANSFDDSGSGAYQLTVAVATAAELERANRQQQADERFQQGIQQFRVSQFREALASWETALEIYRGLGNRQGEAASLGNLGIAYHSLGEYQQAIDFHQQTLAIAREIGDRQGEAASLGNLGIAYDSLGEYQQAIDFHQQQLAIAREIGDRRGEAASLGNLGIAYISLNQDDEALAYYQQSLEINREIGDVQSESLALWGIALLKERAGQYAEAIEAYQQALVISRGIGDRSTEAGLLNRLGYNFEAQDQVELAIIFYKSAVNTYEGIRESNQALEISLQEAYTTTIESTYRHLADLLLQEDRILEAQRVLDLLKVQELDNYVRGIRSTPDTEAGIPLRSDEQAIRDRYRANEDRLIALGRELANLARLAPEQRDPEQQARIIELRQLEETALLVFQTLFQDPEIVELITRLRNTVGAANIELAELNALRDNLQQLDQNAVVLYPLVLEERLELILVTADAAPVRRRVEVSRVDLNRAIGELRYALESPDRNAQKPAQQLYDWLIRPLAADLAQAEAETIIYSPDLRLRYVPLAALHDGTNWLIESYRVNNITATSLADLNTTPTSETTVRVLAAAFTEGNFEVPVGDRTVRYSGLDHAGPEVETLVSLIPNTVQRLNAAFNPNILYEMDDYEIIHLATHAAFNPGDLEDSHILFGNGDWATLADVRGWSFPNVELVVLSACETALGDVLRAEAVNAAGDPADDINGEEILGFGYLMQQAGADAAIGSLWKVDDGGTQILMSAFYDALSRGGLSKVEALQQAQRDLIRMAEEGDRGGFELAQSVGLDPNDLAHPHYWAPFILIGNGL